MTKIASENCEKVQKRVKEVEQIIKIYEEDVRKDLNNICKSLKDDLIDILENNAKEHNLVLENSVYKEIYLFDTYERVKKPESLKQKLMNKNIITDINGENIDEVKAEILKIDDLIGIKILTNLSDDRNKVIDLLIEKSEKLKQKSIVLNRHIKNMPVIMKNGRYIYKIKGVYREQYKFELQVKSKIDSVWGDLEHNLFYKDYDFNYIKENNKDIMNNIGNLLEQIEKLLFSIRYSKVKFNENNELMNIKHSIDNKYSEYVLNQFGTKSKFEEHLYRICSIYKNMEINEENIFDIDKLRDVDDMNFNHKDIKNNLVMNFEKFKNDNVHIIMLEIILSGIIDNDNYEEVVKIIFRYLVQFNIIESFNQLNMERQDSVVEGILMKIINIIESDELENVNSDFILNVNLTKKYIYIKNKLDDLMDEEYLTESILEEDDDDIWTKDEVNDMINKLILNYILGNTSLKLDNEIKMNLKCLINKLIKIIEKEVAKYQEDRETIEFIKSCTIILEKVNSGLKI